jgi:carbon-monoxide dehydrogenase medium subunit
VIDLNRVEGLAYIREEGAEVVIGAMTRQREVEFSDLVARRLPLLKDAILQVGHRQTRNRGTVGGSLSHLDPSAEIPAVCAALDATIVVQGPNGERRIPFAEYPAGYMAASIELDELVTAVRLPVWPDGHGYGFVEFARRHGDFAIVSAGVLLQAGGDGKIARAVVTVSGVGPAPVRVAAAEAALAGQAPTEALFRAAAEECRKVDALADIHAPSEYRQHLAAVLSRRAMEKAHGRMAGAK